MDKHTAHKRVAFVTADSMSEARRIGRALVEERLAACCNLIAGVRSIYRWKGKVCDDPEVLMVIKTTSECFPSLVQRVQELHGYEVPEVVSLPIVEGSKAYLEWLEKQCRVGGDAH